jgi:hypothetical protein
MKVSPTTARIVNGEENLADWDDEELERGQRRSRNGRWPTKKPTIVARVLHDELVRRRLSKAYDLLRESVYDAAVLLRQVITDKQADLGLRMKAAELIMDRVMGKAPEHVSLDVQTGNAPWQRAFASAVVGIVATEERARELEGEVVEGQVVEGT